MGSETEALFMPRFLNVQRTGHHRGTWREISVLRMSTPEGGVRGGVGGRLYMNHPKYSRVCQWPVG